MAARGQTLRIFPDGSRVEQALVAAAQGPGFVDATGYWSFAQLVERCGGAAGLARRPCTPLTSRWVLSAAASALNGGPFQAFVHEAAFARSALELVFQLKSGDCTADQFAAAVDSFAPSRRGRAAALSRLYHAYEASLAKLGLADQGDLERGSVEALEHAGLPPELKRYQALEVRDVYDFTPLRLRLMLSLAERCQAGGVQFRLELPGAGAPAVDGPVDAVLAQFEKRWEHLEVEARKTDLSLEGRPLAALGRRLFGTANEAPTPAPELTAFSAASPREEARELARRVRRLIDQGTPPEDIAIGYRDLGEEAEALVEALESMGIPSRSRLGAPLASTAVGALALGLPLLADDDYPAEGVAHILESRYAPVVSRGAPDAPSRLFALAAVRDDRVGAQAGRDPARKRLRVNQPERRAGVCLGRHPASRARRLHRARPRRRHLLPLGLGR